MDGRRSTCAVSERLERSPLRHALLCAATLVAVLCLLWQSFLVQTHVHAPLHTFVSGVVNGTTAKAVVGGDQPKQDGSANCPICQERAQSGAFLLPQGLVAGPSPIAMLAPAILATLATMATTRSHAWQSRAPPLPLGV